MKNMRPALLYLALSLFLFSSSGESQAAEKVPADAQNIINSLPGKKMTMEVILGRAAQKADSFKAVEVLKSGIKADELRSMAPFDTRLYMNYGKTENETEPFNNFTPESINGNSFGLGISHFFSTGTQLSFEFNQGYNDIIYPDTGNPLSTLPRNTYYESRGTLKLSQNLLQDSFGYGSRRLLEMGRISTDIEKINYTHELEKWTLDITELFYSAWYSQNQVLAAKENLKRREKLLATTKLRLERGTTEEPDYLQIKAAHYLAQSQLLNSEQDMNDRWRFLIIALKLPGEWTQVDPIHIPIQLDQQVIKDAIQICKDIRTKGVPSDKSSRTIKAELQAQSAKLNYEKAANENLPDLEITGSYFANGIDDERSVSMDEMQAKDHPGWMLGLTFSMPLERSLEKSKAASAKAAMDSTAYQKVIEKDNVSLEWLNECSSLDRWVANRDRGKLALDAQNRRANLEAKRYQLGRSSVFNTIQAGDDATVANLNHAAAEIGLRRTSWKILRLNDQIYDRLSRYISEARPLTNP